MPRRSGSDASSSTVHQLKITLAGTKPPVWRRLVVLSDITLGSLHDLVQEAFGWQDMHLHAFEDRLGRRYAPLGDFDVPGADEDAVTLAEALSRTGEHMEYTYDFGNDWRHRIAVEAVRSAAAEESGRAVCTGGRRAMPDAEDLGGVWGLAELLQRYADGEQPSPTIVREGGREWLEYDSLRDEVLADLYEDGFDPAAFDASAVTDALADVPLRRATAARAGKSVPSGTYRCEGCGELHPVLDSVTLATDDDLDDDVSLSDVLDTAGIRLPAVRLPGEAELADAVRDVPAFMAAVRLGRWCAGRGTQGLQLTPKGVLRPALARQAVEEAELWRIAADEWGDPEDRAARLAKIRSAADMEPVNLPWEWALNCGFVQEDGSRAWPGDQLPDPADDAELLGAWQETTAGAIAEITIAPPEPVGLLGVLGPLEDLFDEMPPLVFLMLLAAYALPDGQWLEVEQYLGDDLEGLAEGPARQLVSALLAGQYEEATETLQQLGALERTGHTPPEDTSYALLSGRSVTLPTGRLRLTPLGRSGLRTLLTAAGVPAPVVGSLARADAAELLAALGSYADEQDAAREVAGWLAARSPADAAVQVVDACAGTEPADALRRLQAPRVLSAALADDVGGRAKAVLRKAAVSQVVGCSHAAASMLRRIGEPAEGQAARGFEWMLIDGALPYLTPDGELLRERLLSGPGPGQRPLDQVAEHAEDLWRAGHPHTHDVLGALADAVHPLDKVLAKRLRKAAFKAGSVT
ncbi:plasmid pRiA4b ORF-3 family protein [Streptomyces sp. NPDC001817]|uniref:plasmid pRiA4b ORF-3 family protein n=1 Tax=Streptomyces sp. NPDC001817 TaxID=3154398 RepID=UPI00332B423F